MVRRNTPAAPGRCRCSCTCCAAKLRKIRKAPPSLNKRGQYWLISINGDAVSWFATPQVQAAFAYVGVWFLLIGGVRPVAELQTLRRRGRMPGSDADQLAGLTHLPAVFWVFLFYLVNLATLVIGAFMLAGQWLPAITTP